MDKLLFRLQPSLGDDLEFTQYQQLLDLNKELHDMLRSHKNMISNHHNTKVWDWYKRMSNEYEFVFTSNSDIPSSATFTPVSRSYFKLWEIMHDFCTSFTSPAPMRVAFLAEGPGGFIEAFWRFRNSPEKDKLFAMTLLSSDRRVPQWKLSRQMLPHIIIEHGADGTGNLYNPANVSALIEKTGEANCDLVTADGGFDFSSDFNNQEVSSLQLLYAETCATFRLQKKGGMFILKIFDVSSEQTMLLLQTLTHAYDVVHIIKPFTSRPANSEKYVICQGFQGVCDATMSCLKTVASTGDFQSVPHSKLAYRFLAQITELNSYYVIRQILYIIKTIVCIEESGGHPELTDSMLKLHSESSRGWCAMYGLLCLNQNASGVSQKQTTCS